MKIQRLIFILACALSCAHATPAQRPAHAPQYIAGVVRDEAGSPVGAARVTLTAGASAAAASAETDQSGHFVIDAGDATQGTLTIKAEGFADAARVWKSADGESIEIVLAPAPVSERVTVTATRSATKIGETAASVVRIDARTLARTAAVTLDDALRQVPGFQLFRRAGSRAANPTAQGVSLRGVGASGASRALVLFDGVPLNDPFGGWVYWGRAPRLSIESVEVLRGGASDLYGSSALGGVVNVIGKRVAPAPAASLEASYDSQRTLDASLFTSARRGKWGASLSAERFHTGGYFLLDGADRGDADTRAASRYSTANLTLERDFTRDLRAFVRGSYFGEARDNGTRLQRNRTHFRQFVTGLDWAGVSAGDFTLRAHASSQVYDQSFSAVSADRDAETLTRLQRVPAQAAGFSLLWSRAVAARHVLVAGFEARAVRGASDEIIYASNRPVSLVGAGGRETSAGAFVEDVFRVTPKIILTAGARFDAWRNHDAFAAARPVANPTTTVETFPDRSESAFSPRGSALYVLTSNVSLHASIYRAFRAPTLNELYRDFRVGNVLTLANENLRAERLAGGEAGASFSSDGGRFNARATLFRLGVSRPVANATLSETPTLITRQRRNLGRTRSTGVELDADLRLDERWSLAGGYQFVNAVVVSFPVDASLEGLRVPQVPRHNFTARLDYSARAERYAFSLQARASSSQFEDDLNRLPLGAFLIFDAHASRRLSRRAELFVSAENLLHTRYEVGRTPLTTLGPPLSVRAGLRINLGAR